MLFQYGAKHNWCARNPVREVKIPSDKDAQRIHVVSAAEEARYFSTCECLEREQLAKSRRNEMERGIHPSRTELSGLHDLARTMLLQGARPSEVMQAHLSHLNLETGKWFIPESKKHGWQADLEAPPGNPLDFCGPHRRIKPWLAIRGKISGCPDEGRRERPQRKFLNSLASRTCSTTSGIPVPRGGLSAAWESRPSPACSDMRT